MSDKEERFDPAHHGLDYAAKRLKQIGENDYTSQFAHVLGRREIDDEQLRLLVREEVHRAIYPVAELTNPHEHRRIEMVEESGLHWRGVLYATNAEPPYTPLSGVCWACLKPGDDMQWYSREGRSHLIHKSEECRKLAAEKPESKEHRG